ncbi:hypothetical protein CPB85DRAFT_1209557 [Mucidula mucida]|nr:hypothetical protein CPB85DRAFT_1209557 [Mucidula mucida]
MAESIPPPIYSQEDPTASSEQDPLPEPQILISPTVDAINFQKGYLGADGERAAIEGELQIKGAEPGRWHRITMSLRTVENAYGQEIELGKSDLVLFSSSLSSVSTLPSSILFAVPLMPDSPQCIRTAHSSLTHSLIVTLHPTDNSMPSISKSLTVHTRRYSSHDYTVPIAPETYSLTDPITVNVQVPRATFKAGEEIPLYVTIPPPKREVVLDQGLRLRNVRAEFVRVVTVKGNSEDTTPHKAESCAAEDEAFAESSTMVKPDFIAAESSPSSTFKTVLARSGASCRFHATKPLQLRFVLHQASPSGSPSEHHANLPNTDYGHIDSDAECPSISQSTLLHSISFNLNVLVSLVDTTRHTEHIYTITIPVHIIPPPAPLPEVAQSIDTAYQKKHDRPPAKTNRLEDVDFAPHYSEGEAGPSAIGFGAPPPFEERDAPPPFFFSAAEASTSAGLPTFLESETEIIIPSEDTAGSAQPTYTMAVVGEGSLFGFVASNQFDGHAEDMQRSSTPPPTLEMAPFDTDVTELADVPAAGHSIETLSLVFEQEESAHDPPPPPPAMDDPSDPPPSIDSDFRLHDTHNSSSSPEPLGRRPVSPPPTVNPQDPQTQGHAPPPYGIPGNVEAEQEHVNHPPPYVG